MAGLYSWLQQTWSSLAAVADLSAEPTQTDDPSYSDPCHLFQDALDEELRLMDLQNQRISDLLDQFWACRKSAQTVSELSLNTTQQSLNGAKLLMTTAANRVRQVRDEIDIVTRQDSRE